MVFEEIGSGFPAERMWSGGTKFPAGGSQKVAALEFSPGTPVKATAIIHKRPGDGTPSKYVQPKLPAGDSPYVRAKHVQLVEKDPNKAIPLFWAAINSGDRVDSALKDMAVVMKQVNRAEEAIEAIKSFRHLCSTQAQEPLDNVLLDLYKKCGRTDDQIELLIFKLKMIDEGLAFGGRTTKLARSQGKKFHVSLVQEKSRLLGNLAWAHMQSENYKEAEPLYQQALAIEPDYNKQCNLAICLMNIGRVAEAKSLLQGIKEPSRKEPCTNSSTEPYLKSFQRASEMLMTLESQSELHGKLEGLQLEGHVITVAASTPLNDRKVEDFNDKNLNSLNEFSSPLSAGKWKRVSVSEGVPSPSSSSWKSLTYATPSSENRKGRWVKCIGYGEASDDVGQQRWEFSCNKALFSPASADGSPELEPTETLTTSKVLVNGEHSGTSIQNQYTTFGKPVTVLETERYPIEDNGPNPELTREPPTHIGISQHKAVEGLSNDALSAIAGGNMIPASENLFMGSRRQAEAVKEEATCQRWKNEQLRNSDNISVTGSIYPNPPAQDCLFTNGERRTKANYAMDKYTITANGRISANAPSKESGSNMKGSEDENQCQNAESYIKGSQRCNDIGEEEVASGIMKMGHLQNLDLDDDSVWITENMKPAEDPSSLTSSRKHFAEPRVPNCRAQLHILNPNTPIQSQLCTLARTHSQVSFGSLSTSMNVNQIQGSDVSTDIGRQILSISKNDSSQNSDNTSASIDKIQKFRSDSPVSYGGIRTWADMADKEEEENLSNENLSTDVAADHAIGSCKNSSEQYFKTPPASNSRKSWADMVEEEEEYLANEKLNHGAEFDSHSGSCKYAYIEQPVLKSSVSFSELDSEGFPDENVNLNIVRSTPRQKHQMPQKHDAKFCQKLSMVDLKEWSENGTKTPRRNLSARRSLSFDQQPMWDLSRDCSVSFFEAGFEDSDHIAAMGSWSNCEMNLKPSKCRNRLRVFQEITLDNSARD